MTEKFDVEFSPEALRNLRAIRDYIAKDSPSRAEEFPRMLFERALTLGTMPKRCPVIPEDELNLKRERRHLIVEDYRIIFKLNKRKVQISTIMHGSRVLP